MKPLLLATCLLLVSISYGQKNSTLSISTTGNSNLRVSLSGKKYSLQDRSVTFQSLNPGSYQVTIFQMQRKNGRDMYVKVFDNRLTLKPRKHLEISVLRFGNTAFDESDIEDDNWADGAFDPDPVSNSPNGWRNRNEPVDDSRFAAIKKTIENEINETQRLKTCAVAMKDNWFTIDQIRKLAQTFYNETNKLEMVKQSYKHCVDKGSYVTLTDLFINSQNRKSLLDFIDSQ